jgi:HEAT repeat protein
LRPYEALEARLAENARRDRLPSVRLGCLEVLLQERPGHPATSAAVRAALADADGGVRLAAALASPGEGRAILLEVARDPASSDAVASRALAIAGAAIEGDALELILRDALGAGKPATVAVCLDGLARDGAGRVPAIARVLESEDVSHAAAAARALGATGARAAAPALVRALAHADEPVRAAAAESLGRVGAATEDVLALRQAEAAHPWDGTFLRAVREAIASVQSRIVGADHGQLALAQPAGEVSLVKDETGGRLSRVPKPD